MKRKKLKYEDRKAIEQLVKEGKDPREIAERIGVHFTTIYGELRRCAGAEYNADKAQSTL